MIAGCTTIASSWPASVMPTKMIRNATTARRRLVVDAAEQRIRDVVVEQPGQHHADDRRRRADHLAHEPGRERRHDEEEEDRRRSPHRSRSCFTCLPACLSATRSTSAMSPAKTKRRSFSTAGGTSQQVLLVALRQHERLDAGAVRREDLLLQPADRQHAAAQRDLAGHRHVAADRPPRQRRDHRRRDRDAGRRAFLRHRARRHVHVDVVLLEHLGRDAAAPASASARTRAPPAPTRASPRRAGR